MAMHDAEHDVTAPSTAPTASTRGHNLALDGAFVSPVSLRPLVFEPHSAAFVTPDGTETFPCLERTIPDFRVGETAPPAEELRQLRARLDVWWHEAEAEREAAQTVAPSSRRDERRYWRLIARAEVIGFAAWLLRGRRPYTQRESMARYRIVTDVYPNALRREVPVLVDGRLARCPLLQFKRLSLAPIVDLIRQRGVRSVLDFGCGWGANTLLLKQLLPELDVWSFDLSPQRVVATQFNLERLGLTPYRLFVADGSRLPLADSAVDLVFTTHVLEQMNEVLPRALAEIHRVARRFGCHVEPAYRYAEWPHRLRVVRLGYPRDIAERSLGLGWMLVDRRPASPAWGRTPGELIVLEK